ncbi:hypothetical protein [Halodesulfovibrio sp. MK-HDV]|jgi:hypothetical protein|uniref:hypothetical protein n=1 Tax=Halodesulfovibrio sp. MK-HDV TaxID=2599925 RepID=UPI00136F8761|nr:hypothetical protein [Halodesulfovibrio sp. MK-HDV]KAF1077356.1 hypothetical protein MKHDV_00420 [Halodesulfovibrio sp. MK-HDV]
MNKTVWVSLLEKDEAKGRTLFETLHKYGLNVGGHFWSANNEEMEWSAPLHELEKNPFDAWLIQGTESSFSDSAIRYGLSSLALTIQAAKGHEFPIILQCTDGLLDAATLPTPLQGVTLLKPTDNIAVKAVAIVNIPATPVVADYRLAMHPMPKLGQWIEVGPTTQQWNGMIFAVDSGEITDHGVGPAEIVPAKSVVNFPMKGITLQHSGKKYTGWAVKNQISAQESYYLRFTGTPSSILFGQLPEGEEADLFSITLS